VDPDLAHGFHRRIEIRPYPPRRSREVMFVAKSVGFYLVPSMADLAHQFGVRNHLLPQAEEGGTQGKLIEPVEHMGSGAGVRTVVEGQRHPVGVGPPPSTEVAWKGANGQPLSQADHAGHHVRRGGQADRDQDSSRRRPPVS